MRYMLWGWYWFDTLVVIVYSAIFAIGITHSMDITQAIGTIAIFSVYALLYFGFRTAQCYSAYRRQNRN